ncbi:MAG TPA: MEDS domain-containing protein, partial [Kofleriaceae bacterium]|nr:MEDS domain-containing protein [Kofleriaceae bacterium]
MRATGLPSLGDLPWGSHLCQFFRGSDDLSDLLVPFFRAGLDAGERCLWIAAAPLPAEAARAALATAVPDLDERTRRGQIEIVDLETWQGRRRHTGTEAMLRGWLEREAQALADGHAGLRLAINAGSVRDEDWADFAAYEAALHGALDGRRILALCSYPLDRGGSEEIMDVVRNHGWALVPRNGGWEGLQSATLVLATVDELSPPELATDAPVTPDHVVRLFEEDSYPAADIAAYLRDGLRAGAALVVLATAPHLQAIRAALDELGGPAPADGQLVLGDAAAIAARAVVGGEALRPVFDELVGVVVRTGLARFGRVRAYGEIVDVLSRARDPENAVRLEHWWNELMEGRPIELLCGYSLESFAEARSVAVFRRMCSAHGDVVPVGGSHGPVPKASTLGDDSTRTGRLMAELQQSAAALAHESLERQRLEQQRDRLREDEQTARLRALQAADQMGRLQRITASLAEVATVGEIAAIVADDLAEVSGASAAVLAVPADERTLQRLGRRGAPTGDPDLLALDSGHPLAQAFLGSRPLWAPAGSNGDARMLACLPLLLRGRVLGALELTYPGSYEPPVSERALLEDQARQVAIALDRAHSYQAAERARDEAEQERLRAESASRAKDEFLAMLGHELRNPLAPIVTALQLMKLRGDVRSTKEQTIIERQVQHLVRLVDDLLDVSRITRGKVELRRREIDMADVIARAV